MVIIEDDPHSTTATSTKYTETSTWTVTDVLSDMVICGKDKEYERRRYDLDLEIDRELMFLFVNAKKNRERTLFKYLGKVSVGYYPKVFLRILNPLPNRDWEL